MTRKIYVYSETRDYLTDEYLEEFKKTGAELIKGTPESLLAFIAATPLMQLDTETNVTEFYTDRELYVIQLGSRYGEEQHIIDVKDMEHEISNILRELFNNKVTEYIAHNAKFEYIVLYKHFGIYISNLKDTMLASRLITAGLEMPAGYNSLASLVMTRFGIDLSKGAQTSFTGEKMTPEQLFYAVTDVLYLGKLLDAFMPTLKKWGLMKVFNLENKSIRPIGDLTINGVLVDKEKLDANIIAYDTEAAEQLEEMIQAFKTDKSPGVQEQINALNVIQAEDEVKINWGSSTQKRHILNYFYPEHDITSVAKPVLTKLEKEAKDPKVVGMILNGNFTDLEMMLASRHVEFLTKHEMFVPKGNLNINFNSNDQLLAFFKIWYPDLTAVGVKQLKKLKHPVVEAYKKYTKTNKLVTSFGRKMYEYIEPDGRIHSNFNQLVPTGSRMSSSRPNMQQAPSTERYRSMFIPAADSKWVDSDYASAELFISAYLSGEKVLMDAIEKGYDLHSFSALQIFGQIWLDAGGEAEPVGKPATKEANKMRGQSKSLSFSLLYGTGVVSFSENCGITVNEGKILMKKYYDTFPQLADFFTKSGEEALKFNYVREPHFGRVRFFNKPKNGMEASHNKNAGMNYKPQSINMSIMKYALCLMKKYIEDNDLDDLVKLSLSVHDQQLSEVKTTFAPEWAIQQTRLMEQAALASIPTGALKAESDILDFWTKG
jgi:DNA polymerase I-like protein with 3'-5' exonuclease and polymerase domains